MVCRQDCTLWQSFGLRFGLCGFANVCNVGGVSFFFFCGWEEKNKINSVKFAQSCQKAKSFLILILSISYLSARHFLFSLVANDDSMNSKDLRDLWFQFRS
jgi:hypothetical protein